MQESMSDRRFLGLPVRELEALGLDPRRRIVPLWFGCRAALAAVPSSCPIEVSGRSQFKLFINGVSVHFGPCRSAREVAYVDSLDIAPWLRAGENRLAMQVFSYPEHPGEEEGPYHCFGDDEGPAISVTPGGPGPGGGKRLAGLAGRRTGLQPAPSLHDGLQ